MAEIIGIIGGSIQIADTLVGLGKSLRRCMRGMRDAPKQIDDFKRETQVFSLSLSAFHEITVDAYQDLDSPSSIPSSRMKMMKKMKRLIRAILEQSEKAKRGIEKFVRRVKEFDDRSLIARIKWFLQQSAVKELYCILQTAKSNVRLVTMFINYQVLQKKIEKLERQHSQGPALVEYKKRVKILKAQVKSQNEMIRTQERDLQNLVASMSKRDATWVSAVDMQKFVLAIETVERFSKTKSEEIIMETHPREPVDSVVGSQRISNPHHIWYEGSPARPQETAEMQMYLRGDSPQSTNNFNDLEIGSDASRGDPSASFPESPLTPGSHAVTESQSVTMEVGHHGESEAVAPEDQNEANEPESNEGHGAIVGEEILLPVIQDDGQNPLRVIHRKGRLQSSDPGDLRLIYSNEEATLSINQDTNPIHIQSGDVSPESEIGSRLAESSNHLRPPSNTPSSFSSGRYSDDDKHDKSKDKRRKQDL